MVKNDYGTEYEAWDLNGLEDPLEKKKQKKFRVLRFMSLTVPACCVQLPQS
jgi:hypothetical protein